MWCWLDLHTAVDKHEGLSPWPYLISIWQSRGHRHNASCLQQVNVYNASMSLMHICPMSNADFYVDGSDGNSCREAWGLRCLIYCPLFRRKWASYTSDYNKRWTTQLEPTSKASLCSLLFLLKTKQEGVGYRGGAVCSGFSGNSPDFPSAISELSAFADTEMLSEFWMESNLFSIVLVWWSGAVILSNIFFVPLLQGRMAWMSPQWLNARILILAWENDCNPISCYYILLNCSYFWNRKHLSSFLPLWAQAFSMD